jgi:hypothetical protein
MADVIATLWGLITFAGFVVSLQIGKADDLGKEFEKAVSVKSWERAHRWAQFVRNAPVAVAAVAILTVAGYWVSAKTVGQFEVALLALPVLTQAGFVVIVRSPAGPVPRLRSLRPLPLEQGADRASKGGSSTRLMVRFRNLTRQPLTVCWVDFQGNLDEAERESRLGARDEIVIDTYRSHRWLVRTLDKREVALFDADRGIADVTEQMLRLAETD